MPTLYAKPDCPRCHLPLPHMPVKLRHDGVENGELILTVQVDPPSSYWASVRLSHPFCFGDQDDVPTEVAA